MTTLVTRTIAAFPEPVIVFDYDEATVAFINPAVKVLLPTESSEADWEGEKLAALVESCGMPWDDSIAKKVCDDGCLLDGHYRDDIHAWVIGSRCGETIGGTPLGVVTVHPRSEEAVAWLQHTRIRGFLEMALYISDARADNATVVRLVQTNYGRLDHLESSLTRLVDETGALRLR